MRVAGFDASSGVSGDLVLGALVDAGVPLRHLQEAVDAVGIQGLRLCASRTVRGGMAATRVDVACPVERAHRHLSDIRLLLEGGSLPRPVAADSLRVFERLAGAEAAVHGVAIEHVHFHEVGAADAVADIVGGVAGIHWLGVSRVLVGPINVGSGHVRCAHGVLPVPAPATAALLDGWVTRVAGPVMELTTPTGAALLTTLARQVELLPAVALERTGHGAGGADPPGWANVLRLQVGVTQPS